MKRRLIVAAIFASCVITACGGSELQSSNAEHQTLSEEKTADNWVSDSISNMSFEVSSSWYRKAEENKIYYYPLGENDSPTHVLFYLSCMDVSSAVPYKDGEATSNGLKAAMVMFESGLKENDSVVDFKSEYDEFNGRPAIHAEYTNKNSSSDYYTHVYAAMISDVEIAYISYGTRKGTEDIYKDSFDRIINSLSYHDSENATAQVSVIEDEYEVAEYDKFNSLASENGLGGTKVQVNGQISEVIFDETNIIGLVLKQADEREWIISIGIEPIVCLEKVQSFIGKPMTVYGVYPGLSLEFKKPMILLDTDSKSHMEDNEKKEYTFSDFLSDKEDIIKWCDENEETEIAVEQIEDAINKKSFRKSSGRISSIYDSLNEIYLYQLIDGEYVGHPLSIKKTYFSDTFDLNKLEEDEAVTAYYYVSEDGTPNIIDIIPTDKVTFTFDDMVKAYKDSCQSYTYEQIARNPDKVKDNLAKVKGKVIQVLESGNTVELRVNITAKSYGYYDDTVYVYYYRMDETEDRILEDDIITVYGRLNGLKTYTSVMKSEITLPEIVAQYIEINN